MSIVIGADLVPTKSNFELFNNGNAVELVGEELVNILKNADYRVFNLEVPLTDKETPIDKCGPNLIAPTSTIKGYTALGVDLLTIANNHILDQGEQGFNTTVKLLDDNNISYLGGGQNLEQASQGYVIEINGKKIGFYACAEHEFSIATGKTCGANPFDPLESFDHVVELKNSCDYLIVLYHGGKEHYRYPSPNLQKTCRKFVEKGANLVLCQHSHCVGCKEDYRNGVIIYGQGNFLFDFRENEFWQTGFLIKINDNFTHEYIPIIKSKNGVRFAEKDVGERIIENFNLRSEQIKEIGFIDKQYSKYAKEVFEEYLYSCSSVKRGLSFRIVNKLFNHKFSSWFLKKKYSKKHLLSIKNYIECEAHRELFLRGVKDE